MSISHGLLFHEESWDVWSVSQCPLNGTETTYIWSAVDLRDHIVQGGDQRIRGSGQVGVAVQEEVQSSTCHLMTSFQNCQSIV